MPLVGINSGRCFAGNAALAGCCDVIIATEDANLGMAGPAMIEGGGLGVFTPDEVGPMSVQVPNGVVDLLVPDDAAAESYGRDLSAFAALLGRDPGRVMTLPALDADPLDQPDKAEALARDAGL